MADDPGLMAGSGGDDAFEMQMRGYSRRQVDAFVASSRSQARDLEEQLARSLGETGQLRTELQAARQALRDKPAHEQVSERVAEILQLADQEANAQRARAQDEADKVRDQARQDADRFRAKAREQAEHVVAEAREQAENAVAAAQAEIRKMRETAHEECTRAVSTAAAEAKDALAAATSRAKQMLDQATARASAIDDGAERRLNLLTVAHAETMRQLTAIRDAVTTVVAADTARGPLEDEVAKSAAATLAADRGQAQEATADRESGLELTGTAASGPS